MQQIIDDALAQQKREMKQELQTQARQTPMSPDEPTNPSLVSSPAPRPYTIPPHHNVFETCMNDEIHGEEAKNGYNQEKTPSVNTPVPEDDSVAASSTSVEDTPPLPCVFWAKLSCSRGNKCKFAHLGKGGCKLPSAESRKADRQRKGRAKEAQAAEQCI
jgi:hypothetical protein